MSCVVTLLDRPAAAASADLVLRLKATSQEYLEKLQKIRDNHPSSEWSDPLSSSMRHWIQGVLDYRASSIDTEDDILHEVQKRLDDLDALLVEPLQGKPLEAPVIEITTNGNRHIWNRRDLDDYLACFQRISKDPIISAYSEDRPDFFVKAETHTFSEEVLAWRSSLPYNTPFQSEMTDSSHREPLQLSTRLQRRDPDATSITLRHESAHSTAYTQEEALKRIYFYRSAAVLVLMKRDEAEMLTFCEQIIATSVARREELEAQTALAARKTEEMLGAYRRETDARIDNIEGNYAQAAATKDAHIDDLDRRLGDEVTRHGRTREELAGARAETAALRREVCSLRHQVANIDTDSGCVIQ